MHRAAHSWATRCYTCLLHRAVRDGWQKAKEVLAARESLVGQLEEQLAAIGPAGGFGGAGGPGGGAVAAPGSAAAWATLGGADGEGPSTKQNSAASAAPLGPWRASSATRLVIPKDLSTQLQAAAVTAVTAVGRLGRTS